MCYAIFNSQHKGGKAEGAIRRIEPNSITCGGWPPRGYAGCRTLRSVPLPYELRHQAAEMSDEQMIQNESLLRELTEAVILPILSELSKETAQPISARVSISHAGVVTAVEICTSNAKLDNEARAEVRVLLKDGAMTGNFNFSAESIFERLSPGTGFSGFSIRGKIQIGDQGASAKLLTRTNRYNVWNWGKGFAF